MMRFSSLTMCFPRILSPQDFFYEGRRFVRYGTLWRACSPASPSIYEDNDTLAKGWEDIFNLSCELFGSDYKPVGHELAPELFMGKFWSTNRDSDNDGIPDGDEDCDGDGWNNTAEYRGKSDPTDAESKPNHDPYQTPNRRSTRGGEDEPPVEESRMPKYVPPQDEPEEKDSMEVFNVEMKSADVAVVKRKQNV